MRAARSAASGSWPPGCGGAATPSAAAAADPTSPQNCWLRATKSVSLLICGLHGRQQSPQRAGGAAARRGGRRIRARARGPAAAAAARAGSRLAGAQGCRAARAAPQVDPRPAPHLHHCCHAVAAREADQALGRVPRRLLAGRRQPLLAQLRHGGVCAAMWVAGAAAGGAVAAKWSTGLHKQAAGGRRQAAAAAAGARRPSINWATPDAAIRSAPSPWGRAPRSQPAACSAALTSVMGAPVRSRSSLMSCNWLPGAAASQRSCCRPHSCGGGLASCCRAAWRSACSRAMTGEMY